MAATYALGTGLNITSDIFTPAIDTVAISVQCKSVDATGGVVEFLWLSSLGDIDTDATDDYATIAQANKIVRLDTSVASPSVSPVIDFSPCETLKIYADNEGAATATVSAFIMQIKADGTQTKLPISWPAP